MSPRHYFALCVLVGLILEGLWALSAHAQTEAVPATTEPALQQSQVYRTPTVTYPSYPSTSAPEVVPAASTTTPTTNNTVPNDPGPLYTPYGSPEAMNAALLKPPDPKNEQSLVDEDNMEWQILPTGLMYRSYLAGNREPRMGSELVRERNHGWLWNATVGGRAGILRYGTNDAITPQGWQLDIEGAAFPRLDLEHEEDLMCSDFRGGLLSTERHGLSESKFGYYHLSSHLGDEYMLRNPLARATRLNYSRDCLIWGTACYPAPSLREYFEVGWAFHEDGGASPWEFQFGFDYSSLEPTGICGAPFFAINAHLRQENDFGGNMTVQTGWQWRGHDGHLLRTGMQYYNGMSDQGEFYNQFEEQIGFGLWYDF
jgi:hypothetical protein